MLLLADEGPPPPPPPPPPWPSISDRKSTRSSSQGTSQQILPAWQPPLSIPGRLPAQGSPGGRRLPSPSIGNPGGHHSQSPPRPLQSASASRFHENRSFPSSPLQSRCISERKLLSAVWRERERDPFTSLAAVTVFSDFPLQARSSPPHAVQRSVGMRSTRGPE